jgi:peptidoglycan/LPS O-acetylase OafA/YrhL
VLLNHLIGGESIHGPARVLIAAFREGWMGVDLFFALSGFLITRILLDTPRGPGYFTDFYARRVLRIFPLYYGVLAVVFFVLPHMPAYAEGLAVLAPRQVWLWTYTTNLAAAWGVFFNAPGIYLEHLWSLAIEEQFYLLWPAVVYLTAPRTLGRICLAIVVGSLALRLVAAGVGATVQVIFFATPCRVDALAAGALLAVHQASVPARSGHDGERTPLIRAAPFVATGALLTLVALTWRFGDLRTSPGALAVTLSLAALLSGALIVLVTGGSGLSRFVCAAPLRTLGKYSYGIYVIGSIQQPHLERWLSTRAIAMLVHPVALAAALHFAAHLAVYTVVAALVHHAYEKPFLRLKRYFEPRAARSLKAV